MNYVHWRDPVWNLVHAAISSFQPDRSCLSLRRNLTNNYKPDQHLTKEMMTNDFQFKKQLCISIGTYFTYLDPLT